MLTSTHFLSFYMLRNHSCSSGVFLFLGVKSFGIFIILLGSKMTAGGSSCLKV